MSWERARQDWLSRSGSPRIYYPMVELLSMFGTDAYSELVCVGVGWLFVHLNSPGKDVRLGANSSPALISSVTRACFRCG